VEEGLSDWLQVDGEMLFKGMPQICSRHGTGKKQHQWINT